MIQPITCFEVICDRCGEHLDYDGITAWISTFDAIDALNYCDWRYMDDEYQHVYCPSCYCYVELNDNLQIDE